MSAHVLSEAARQRANTAYRVLREVTGLGKWLVRAYVLARVTGADPAEACARAHFGLGLDQLGPGGVEAAHYWVAKLDRVVSQANPVREQPQEIAA